MGARDAGAVFEMQLVDAKAIARTGGTASWGYCKAPLPPPPPPSTPSLQILVAQGKAHSVVPSASKSS